MVKLVFSPARRWFVVYYATLVLAPISDLALAEEERLPILSTAAEVRSLTPLEAEMNYPVRLEGVITFFDAPKNLAFIQDDTGAVYFASSGKRQPDGPVVELNLQSGVRAQIQGFSEAGRYSPTIGSPTFELLDVKRRGRAAMPEPIRMERGYLLSPTLDCMWVQVDATVEEVVEIENRRALKLQTGSQRFIAVFSGPAEKIKLPQELVGAEIRLRGVYDSMVDAYGRLTGLRLFVPDESALTVLDRGGKTAFDQPPVSVRDLLRFRPDSRARVRVDGLVTAAFADGRVYLRMDESGLLLRASNPAEVKPGDFVQAAGFPLLEEGQVVLEDALIKVEREDEPVEARFVRLERLAKDPALADQLVEIDAHLVDFFQQEDRVLMALEESGQRVLAELALAPGESLPPSTVNSWVRVIGILEFEPRAGEEAVTSDAAWLPRLRLRSPEDLVILREPPFWTVRRVMWMAGTMVVLLAGGLIWVVILNRRLEYQTKIIAQKVEKERIDEERTRIARELHDTLEQELAGIGMQLDLASSRMRTQPERAAQPLDLALQMLRRSQAEARRSINNLRSGLLEQQNLADAIREMIALSQKPNRPTISLKVEGTPRKLATRTEHNLLRICQEAINNVNKHAGSATKIDLLLRFSEERVVLIIEDDGAGFEQTTPKPPAANGRKSFGLLGMRERASKIGGSLTVESKPGEGTRITLDAVALEPGTGQSDDLFSPHSTPPPA